MDSRLLPTLGTGVVKRPLYVWEVLTRSRTSRARGVVCVAWKDSLILRSDYCLHEYSVSSFCSNFMKIVLLLRAYGKPDSTLSVTYAATS